MNEETIFAEAAAIASPVDRTKFLDGVCAGNAALRAAVDRLLLLHESAGSFLEKPPVESTVAATILHGDGSTSDDQDPNPAGQPMRDDLDDEIPLGYLQPALQPNSMGRLGHYEILEVIGRGAFGTVLRAFDDKLQRVVAIKVLAPEMAATSPARKRFLREARTSAAIRHENVVSIHAVEDEPIPYLVMEYIPGKTLQQRLDERGPLELSVVLRLGKQIADGLAAAHAQGLIHRDIKPGNILLEGGVTERVKITDFGLARTADDASLTQSGLIAGTPMYMAPEQALGKKLDQRADLFSFGSVLYQMLSGRPPFRAANTIAVLKRVVEDTPRPIEDIIPEVPAWICELVGRLHAKQPDDRYQTAQEVADLLDRCLEDLKAGRTPVIPAPHRAATPDHSRTAEPGPDAPEPAAPIRPACRHPWPKMAAAAALLLIAMTITEATGVTNLTSVIRLSTGSGTLVIETDDPGVKIAINGEEVTIRGGGVEELTLRPGKYKVAALKDGEAVKQELVSITRNGRTVVRMSLESEPATGVEPARATRVAARRNYPTLAPFDAAQWDGEKLRARVAGKWYAVLEIDGLTVAKIIDVCKRHFRDLWQKRFEEDLVEVLTLAGHPPGKSVTLLVKSDEDREPKTLRDVPMTARNRWSLWQSRNADRLSLGQPKRSPADAPPTAIAPFDAEQAKAHQAAWTKYLGVPVEYTNSLGMKLRLIPPGTNAVGQTGIGESKVSLHAGTTEVTVGQFRRFVKETQHQTAGETNRHGGMRVRAGAKTERDPACVWNHPEFAPSDDHPVVLVTWHDAMAFCDWISRTEGRTYRLPTSAEWRWLERAGNAERPAVGGASIDEHAWHRGNSEMHAHVVAARQGNPWGLFDVYGNVWELAYDWRRGSEFVNPFLNKTGPGDNDRVLFQGGAFSADIKDAPEPAAGPSQIGYSHLGFRVVVESIEASSAPPLATVATDPWQPLFNGKDLTGWKTLPELPGRWEVKDGILTGSTKPSYLFSERGDLANFHLRAEIRFNGRGDSGIWFRAPLAFRHGPQAWMVQPASGYEAELSHQPQPRGTLWQVSGDVAPQVLAAALPTPALPVGEWFTLEIRAEQNHLITIVNGHETVNMRDKFNRFQVGHLALAAVGPQSVLEVRRIEIQELPMDFVPSPGAHEYATGEWIDVLPLIDPQLDKWDMRLTGKNDWRIEQGELIAVADEKPSKLLLPLDAEAWSAFECELDVTRRSGEQGFSLNFPAGNGDTPLGFGRPNNPGVNVLVRQKGPVSLADTPRVATGERLTLRIEVRSTAAGVRIVVWNNGVQVGSWTGSREQLVNFSNEGYHHSRRLSLWVAGDGSEYVFHRIRVRTLDGSTASSVRPLPPQPGPPPPADATQPANALAP
jgi:serine/threonine protein kinase/formylglycine-generating enzyme required for sulfatase activity